MSLSPSFSLIFFESHVRNSDKQHFWTVGDLLTRKSQDSIRRINVSSHTFTEVCFCFSFCLTKKPTSVRLVFTCSIWEYRNRNPNRFVKHYRNRYRSTYRGPALNFLMCPHKCICLYETWKRLWVIWDTILLQGWVHASWIRGVGKVVTRSSSRILLMYVTCRHMWTKLEVIQTSVFFSDPPTRIPYFHYISTCNWRVEQFWK